jgi:hypothetical protein
MGKADRSNSGTDWGWRGDSRLWLLGLDNESFVAFSLLHDLSSLCYAHPPRISG